MKVDAPGVLQGMGGAAEKAAQAEAEGYDGLWTAEAKHDPFYPLLLAAGRTTTLQLGTAIAVAFSRNPMSMAVSAHDLQTATQGRFILGLGSQVKPHIERRYSMPWSRPAARMKEYVSALQAIWTSWETGARLDFRGEFYTHTLMASMWSPGPSPFGPPPVFVAGVGTLMTETAGEVADGFICHPFTTERFIRDVSVPALEAGRLRAGKAMQDFEICGPRLVATGSTDAELEKSIAWVRERISYYGSTPAYRTVLELHGWLDEHLELNRMAKENQWKHMPSVVSDDMVGAFSVVGAPLEVGIELARRYGDTFSRVTLATDTEKPSSTWDAVRAGMMRPAGAATS